MVDFVIIFPIYYYHSTILFLSMGLLNTLIELTINYRQVNTIYTSKLFWKDFKSFVRMVYVMNTMELNSIAYKPITHTIADWVEKLNIDATLMYLSYYMMGRFQPVRTIVSLYASSKEQFWTFLHELVIL